MSNDWSQNLANELHKPVKRKFQKRRVFVPDIDDTWAADLVEMGKFSEWNKNIKYLLMVIDVFSKFGWIKPLKNKQGATVARAFEEIFKEGRKPKKLWVDAGKEFWNKQMKDLTDREQIQRYTTQNEEKSSVVERWNRTIKEKIWKMFAQRNETVYWDKLDEILANYNNSKHSSIGMTPVQASEKKNEQIVFAKLYENELLVKRKKPKFAVGDRVRISKLKKRFEKGYEANWSEEIFIVTKIIYSKPVTYKIKDLMDEEVEGSFYEQELQKTNQDKFRIEEVIEVDNDEPEAFVKWSGYPEKFNSWVPLTELGNIEKE